MDTECNAESDDKRRRHPTLYFSDGDIVLQAQATSEVYELFRVHKFILSHNSPFFADMFSIPTPASPDSDEYYDGIPLIPITDNSEGVAKLLLALYNPMTLPSKRLDPQMPFLVHDTLKLATKYQFDSMRTRILDHFAKDWPQTLEEWDRLQAEIDVVSSMHEAAPQGRINGLYLDDRFPEPAAAIRLARDFGCPSVLPSAFYRLTTTPVEWDYDKTRSKSVGETSVLWARCFTARWSILDRDDLILVLAGREKLANLTLTYIETLFGDFNYLGEGCVSERVCTNVRSHMMGDFRHENSLRDPLGFLDQCLKFGGIEDPDDGTFDQQLCSECRGYMIKTIRRLRNSTWDTIQRMYGVL